MGREQINVQDVGGENLHLEPPLADAIDASAKPTAYWEYQTHGLAYLLSQKGLWTTAAMRRAIENLPTAAYKNRSYYERWSAAIAAISLERGTFSQQELDEELGQDEPAPYVRYKQGDYVRVRREDASVRFRKPHLRTPGYIFNLVGWLATDCIGNLEDPDVDAHHYLKGPRQPLYRVRFLQADVWEGYDEHEKDEVEMEIVQPWLLPATEDEFAQQQKQRSKLHFHPREEAAHGLEHEHDHGEHEHGHDHVHEGRVQVEQTAVDREGQDAGKSRLLSAIIRVLLRKGLINTQELQRWVENLESWGQKPLGPRLVAKAWADPEFKKRLLAEGVGAAKEVDAHVGLFARPAGGVTEASKDLTGLILKALENTPEVHHLVVCTLCSCYPIAILGISPSWYKARSYRARAVREPRAVLKEFGTVLPTEQRITVVDSNADTRFIVIPQRPAGTEGWSEEHLQVLVTRDSMIGVSLALQPSTIGS